MKAIDVLNDLIKRYCLITSSYGKGNVGEAVLNLSEEKRKILAKLKSEDLTNLRKDGII